MKISHWNTHIHTKHAHTHIGYWTNAWGLAMWIIRKDLSVREKERQYLLEATAFCFRTDTTYKTEDACIWPSTSLISFQTTYTFPSRTSAGGYRVTWMCVCVCCNAGLGLSHGTELYQATTHSSSRPPALNAPADLSSLPLVHEHERENDRVVREQRTPSYCQQRKETCRVTIRNSRNDTFSEGCNSNSPTRINIVNNFNPSAPV